MQWVIAFDADDTLWHNEHHFLAAVDRYTQLIRDFADDETARQHLLDVERRNIALYGYGTKGFTLSMLESAIHLSQGQVSTKVLATILENGKRQIRAPVMLLPDVEDTLEQLAEHFVLALISKGDLQDQRRKMTSSRLESYFAVIEIVPEKDAATYEAILAAHGWSNKRFVMVGNSIRSDVLPVLEIGARAVHVPYTTTWSHEQCDVPAWAQGGFHTLERISRLPQKLAEMNVDIPSAWKN